jgi:hypothetical protein
MKKYYIFIVIVVLILSIFFIYKDLKNDYIKKFKKLDSHRIRLLYQDPYINYFESNFECPHEIQEAIMLKPNNPDYNNYINRHFKDFLSRKHNYLIHYIPLFNPSNLKREGYVILSSGIDGEINNDGEDTLYITNFKEKLKLYNPESFYKIGDTIKPKSKVDFNIIDYFFGNKDYLIEYINCIDVYKQQARKELSLEDLIKKIENQRIKGRIIGIKETNPIDTIIDNTTYVYFTFNDYLIKNQIYNGYYKGVNSEDTLFLTGTLQDFDEEKQVISFKNSIQLNKE